MPKDFELEIKFKPEARPILCKPRPLPLAILGDLNDAYEEGIRKECGSPLTSILMETHGSSAEGNQSRTEKARIRVCGDHSVTINSQLEAHCQPIPLPEDFMRNLLP